MVPLKIAVVHNFYRRDSPSGENASVVEIVGIARSLGHEVKLVSIESDELLAMRSIRRAASVAGGYYSRLCKKLDDIDTFKPNILHIENLGPGFPESLLRRYREIPTVRWIRNYRFRCISGDNFRLNAPCHQCDGKLGVPGVRYGCYQGSRVASAAATLRMLQRRSHSSRVDRYVAISEHVAETLRSEAVPASRICVRYNTVPDLSFASRTGQAAADTAPVFGLAARIAPAKGIEEAVQVFRKFPHLRLRIAGDGPSLATLRDASRNWPNIEWLGPVHSNDMARFYSSLDFGLSFAQWDEPFGRVVAEMYSASLPVVLSKRGAHRELAIDSRLLVDSSDGLTSLLQDVHRLDFRALGAKARKRWSEAFSPEAGASSLARLYAEVSGMKCE